MIFVNLRCVGCYAALVARALRADEAGGLYHALNRGNLRAAICRKDADYDAFERILRQQRVLTPLSIRNSALAKKSRYCRISD